MTMTHTPTSAPIPNIEFIFDFASPNAYLAHQALKAVSARTGVKVALNPCLLGGLFKATGNQAPMNAFGAVKGKLAYERLEFDRFIAKHGLTRFLMNPHFPVNSLLAMRGLIAAGLDGVAGRYVEAVLAGFWEDGVKMDDPEALRRVLDGAGLDGAGLIAATQRPEVKAELASNTEAAVARGVFGIPTFFVGPEMFFGKERLGQVEEALGARA